MVQSLMVRKLLARVGLMLGAQLLLPAFELAPVLAAELSEIRDRGYLIVAVKDNRPPMGFLDESEQFSGFEIDIARRLAAELLGDENAIELVPTANVDRLNAVIEDQVDMAIASLTITEPRRRIISFSDPYYLDGTAFVPRLPTANSPAIRTLQDLQLGTIAVLDRSSTVAQVRYILPSAQLIGVDTYLEGQALVASGEVDAFAGDASVLTGWTRDGALTDYELLPSIISVEPLAIAIPKGQQYSTLQAEVNAAIQRWYAEEWLQARAEFWGLPEGVFSGFLEPSPLESGLE
ncbi:MAG: transporter substrate-binding domain-containing protein [Cyanobacteria bacterium P01_D01_bin.1]